VLLTQLEALHKFWLGDFDLFRNDLGTLDGFEELQEILKVVLAKHFKTADIVPAQV
jgi:hypothetical protein